METDHCNISWLQQSCKELQGLGSKEEMENVTRFLISWCVSSSVSRTFGVSISF